MNDSWAEAIESNVPARWIWLLSCCRPDVKVSTASSCGSGCSHSSAFRAWLAVTCAKTTCVVSFEFEAEFRIPAIELIRVHLS